MKKITKILALMMTVVMMAAALTGCGSNASLSKAFTCGSSYFIDAVGWYGSDVVTLKVNSDNTYELTYQEHMFGTTDPGVKGLRTVVMTGKCSSAASSDGWATHVDYTLQPAERIYFEQHEKGYGRSAIAGHCVIDTANWTDTMKGIVDPENNAMDAKAFLSKYAETLTITVEDPSLDPEDVSLGNRIITMPDIKLITEA